MFEYNYNLASPFATTCPVAAKYVGQTVTLSVKPTAGTGSFTVTFKRAGVALGAPLTGVALNQTVTTTYTLVTGDSPSVVFSASVVDTCPTGAKAVTPEPSCTVSVASCTSPSCEFSVS